MHRALVASLLALVCWTAAPVSASSTLNHPVPATSLSIHEAAPNAYVRREVFGFAPYWALSQYTQWNYKLVSTVAYFALVPNNDGTFMTSGGGWNGWNSPELSAIISAAHAAGDRVVMVIKDSEDATINKIVTTAATQTLITQTINAIRSKNLDGVNVDFEPDGSSLYPDIPQGLINFMTALYSQVHAAIPGSEVTMDTYAGSASWDGGSFVIGSLAPAVDAFFVMAYDSVFSNMPGQAGPNAPLNGWTFNDTVDVSQYLTKAPASKVILGVPFYGYKWSTTSGAPNAPTTSGATAESYSGVLKDLTCGHVSMFNGWDSLGASPWAAWWSPKSGDPCGDNLGSPQELYYDNAYSLGLKFDLVNANNLRGTGIWALGYDGGAPDLWNELAMKFTTTTPWFTMNGLATSGPHASSWGPTRIDAFVRGSDNGLWQNTFDGTSWSGWNPLGGGLTSGASAISWAANRIDVFTRGNDRALWHRWWTGTSWSGWENLGGSLVSGPEVASWGPGRLDVFAVGNDNGLWHKWWDSTGWHGWESLGGVLTSEAAAVSWATSRVDVFARGTDNALWHKWFDNTGWHPWERLGGYLISGPAVSSCASGHLDVFGVGSDAAAYQLAYTGSWSAWQRLGGQWTSDPGAVCPTGTTNVALLERGPDGALWQTTVPGS